MSDITDLTPQDDFVGGRASTVLEGVTIEYVYSRGTRYRLAFGVDTVEFAVLDHAGPDSTRPSTPPPLAYRARDIRPGIVLVHWIVKPATIHVTLVLDLTLRTIHVAAMMPPNRWEFVDTGTLVRVDRPGESVEHVG
ncbi:MAG: hypothetical protein ABI566_09220 [Pseudolysinimonas sp.]